MSIAQGRLGSIPSCTTRAAAITLSMRRLMQLTAAVVLVAGVGWPAMPASAQGDVFSSGGSPYGRANTTRRTGKQASQDDSVYCQQTPDGQVIPKPYGGTRRNIPCGLPNVARVQPLPSIQPKQQPCSCRTPPSAGREADTLRKTASATVEGKDQACVCPARPKVTPVFNYYYINGMNTPETFPDPHQRGSCMWDRRMIEGNLLDGGKGRVPKESQFGPGFSNSIKIGANEVDVLQPSSCQDSGTNARAVERTQQLCRDVKRQGIPGWGDVTYRMAGMVCAAAPTIDDVRRGNFTNSMAPGDLLECFTQSLHVDMGAAIGMPGTAGIEFTAERDLVKELTRRMIQVYQTELAQPKDQPRQKNYFIVIAHSQGNFFAEGVAYRLMKATDGAEAGKIFKHRFGILSFGSPTSYDALKGDEHFMANRVKPFTREDDGIRALNSVHEIVSQTGLPPPKRPWASPLLPPLWEWPSIELKARLNILVPSWHWDNPLSVNGWMSQLSSPFLEAMGLSPKPGECKTTCQDCDERARCDGALYTPLMNSHLLDNYLTDPTMTMQGKRINAKVSPMLLLPSVPDLPSSFSPRTTPVLRQVRLGLAQLKRNLWKFGGD